MKTTHLVVNYIRVEDNVILVGATDNLRWKRDTEEGMSGADAKTIVYVSLKDNGAGYAVSEEVGFHSSPGDSTRPLAMSYLLEMFEIAWSIKNEKLNCSRAMERFFGKPIDNRKNRLV